MHAVESSAVDRSFGPRSWVRTNGINLSDGYPTLPEILRNAGCRTILAGKPGLVARTPVSLLDFLPTVLDLAGVDYPENEPADWSGPYGAAYAQTHGGIYRDAPRLPGRSLSPVLFGKAEKAHNAALVEEDEDVRQLTIRTIITERFKMTTYIGEEYGHLFDLENDPEERKNLWTDPAHQDIRHELSRKLIDEITQTENRLKRRHSSA